MTPFCAENMRYTRAAYEAFGRLMTVLLDSGPLRHGGIRNVHTWTRLDGGYAVGWSGGPHPAEVAEELVTIAEDKARTSVLKPGDVVLFDMINPGRVRLLVRGMPVELEGWDTTGMTTKFADVGTG
jgi:hypothetical protein